MTPSVWIGQWYWRLVSLLMAAVGTPPDREVAHERKLIASARRRGPKGERAYEELVLTHQAWLVSYLTALLGNRSDAEDVGQDVLFKAYLALDRFRGDARFRSWVRRIATNEAYNSRRKRRETLTVTGDLPDLVFNDESIEAIADRQLLLTVLEKLPYAYREALVLRHVEALDLAEIALSLDIGLGATKMRLKRARDRFAHEYDAMLKAP